jgi:RHS repeat-associated protein
MLLTCTSGSIYAQDVKNGINAGFPPNGDFSGSEFDNVQVNNGNVHMEIPFWSTDGRGLPVSYKYIYDSKGWSVDSRIDKQGFTHNKVIIESGSDMSWSVVGPNTISAAGKRVLQTCLSSQYLTFTNFILRDENGTKHHFLPDPIASAGQTCWPSQINTLYADDGTGWILQIDPSTGVVNSAIGKDGTVVYPNLVNGGVIAEDSNGNELSFNTTTQMLTDTLGRLVPSNGSYYDSSGTLQSFTVTPTNPPVQIQTNFCPTLGGDFCYDFSGAWTPPQQITLPNGLSYGFTYDLQGGPTHPYYGEPLSVTLPTGGQISYTWSGTADDGGPNIVSRLVSGDPGPWQYSGFGGNLPPGQTTTTTVTDPAGNDTLSTCSYYVQSVPLPSATYPTNGICYITQVQYYKGSHLSNSPLKTVATLFSNTNNGGGFVGLVLPTRETTTWNDTNETSKIETDYDSFSLSTGGTFSWQNPIERRAYSYGSGAPGLLVRKTDYNYLHLVNPTYRTANIADRPTSKITYDGSGSGMPIAQTTYSYDGATPAPASNATSHDDTKYSTSYNIRGNLTQVSRWLNTTSTWLNTTSSYNILGNRLSTTDPALHTMNFSYSDLWSSTGCVPSGLQTYAFATLTSLPDTVASGSTVHHRTQRTFYPCSGQLEAAQDENDILASRTGTTYTYDFMKRLLSINSSDGGQTTYTYSDVVPISSTEALVLGNSAANIQTQVIRDGLGRQQNVLRTDPDCLAGSHSGWVESDYTYGYNTASNTRFTTASNPYCQNSDSTYGVTTTSYDALQRVSQVTEADQSIVTTTYASDMVYAAMCSTVTDEALKSRKACSDSLGRLSYVFEDPAHLNYETDYAYNVLDKLTAVTQRAGTPSTQWRSRNFAYDSLGRLTSAANPESGTTTYTYNTDDTVATRIAPSPNQPSAGTSTVTTTYTYDPLQRVTGKSYTDTYVQNPPTSSVTYGYDKDSITCATPIGLANAYATNGVGRRTAICYSGGSTSWAYDAVGRVSSQNDRFVGLTPPYAADVYTVNGVPTISTDTNYAYYLNGDLATVFYPGPHGPSNYEFYTTENSAGHVVQAGDTYFNVLKNATYAPHGGLSSGLVGYTSTYNGNSLFTSYNKRLQPSLISASTASGGSILSLTYNFNLGNGDNGNVVVVTNGRDNNRSQNFGYDALNRISTAYTTGPNWGEIYTIDGWGNLYARSGVAGKTNTEPLSCSANTKNQLYTCYTYDAAGNVIQNGTTTYTYDSENRLISTSGYSYIYDGDGQRVKKCTAGSTPGSCASNASGTFYWRATDRTPLAEADLGGNWTAVYGPIRGQLASRVDLPSNTVHYYFKDHLGTVDLVTDALGNIQEESDYYPYGGEIPVSGTDSNKYKFTAKERDTESGLDMFGARYYGSSLGRFMTPDWAAKPTTVPYANFGNPQSLNLYSYVENNPTTAGDPDGHGDAGTFCNQECRARYAEYAAEHPISATLEPIAEFGAIPTAAIGGAAASGSALVTNLVGLGLATAPRAVPLIADAVEGYVNPSSSGSLTISSATRLSEQEISTGVRLANQTGNALAESGHIGEEFVDAAGKTYDAMGGGKAFEHFGDGGKFFDSVVSHVNKSVDHVAIDLNGASKDQVAAIKAFGKTLTKAQRKKIIYVH